jgi:glycosyltransferase involved in cell wall biosynthesis
MHIAFLLTQDLKSPSGLGRYWPLAKELTRLGYEVTILALHSNYESLNPQERESIRDGVHVRYVGQMHVHKTGSDKQYFKPSHSLWISMVSTLQLARASLHACADVYHIAKPHPMNGIAGMSMHWLQEKPLYLDCDDYEAESNRFDRVWQKKAVAIFEDWLPTQIRGVTTNTRFMEKRLRRLGVDSKQIVYVPNGVDRTRFANWAPKHVETLRTQLGLIGHPTVLYLGSLSPTSHPVELLIKAFTLLNQEIPEARLLLVGGGESYEDLQYQAQAAGVGKKTVFAGRVTPEQAVNYYHLATVSVEPVRDDLVARARSPLKLFESWAAGTPFVTADVGDRRQLLGNSQAGLLTAPGDADSLAAALGKVLKNPNLAKSLQNEGRKRVESFYWDRLVRDFVHLYDENEHQILN